MNWFIYTLTNPRTNEVRYVGFTAASTEQRLQTHIYDSVKRPAKTHRQRWIMSLVSIGLIPVISVLESGSGDGWRDAERKWIAFYRAKGARLVNKTAGGECVPPLTREQLSARRRKQLANMTPERRSAISKKASASRTPEARSESVRRAHASRTPEERSAIARIQWANKTPEERRNLVKQNLGEISPEQHSAMSKKANASRTPEARSAAARIAALVANARRTPEERSASASHAAKAQWAARRAQR